MNNTTELVFILDSSGSMSGMEADTIGGFNSMLARQKEMGETAYITTVLFNTVSKTIHDRIPIEKVSPLTDRDYRVGGGTALLDAIGSTICHIETIHKYARPEDIPAHTIFVITTDGMENASHSFTSFEVKEMISQLKDKHHWEFLFVAANIDAVETAANIGIGRDYAANYSPTQEGTRSVYEAVDCAVEAARKCKPLKKVWKSKLR